MPYNLRNKSFREQLQEEQQCAALDEASSGEENHTSEDSDLDEDYVASSPDCSSAESEDYENSTLDQRLLNAGPRQDPPKSRGRPTTTLRGKNGYKWSTRAPERQSNRFEHVHEFEPGPAGPAVGVLSFEELWSLLFPDEFFNIIATHTNTEIENQWIKMITKEVSQQSYHEKTDPVEIRAYVGLLYFAGAWKSGNVDTEDLWSKVDGLNLFRCTMSKMRFRFLSLCLRFDDEPNRDREDRFSPIRELWEKFIQNCQNCYNLSGTTTVNEQLLSFRGRCKFKMYMKAKPDKYGMKIVTLNDAKTYYLFYGVPYLGKSVLHTTLPNETKPEYYFRVVTAPIHGSNRTVTCDNWFSSVPLFQRFLNDPFNLSITGTIRKNKREIPAEFKIASKTVPDTKFCFSDKLTLLSHTPKKKNSPGSLDVHEEY